MDEEKKINIEDGNAVEEPVNEQEVSDEMADVQSETEENEEAAGEQAVEEEVEEKTPLEKAEEEIAQLKDQYLRARAEFENYRKRTIKEKAELILNGGEKTIQAILPVLDDFERALSDKTEDGVKKIETEDKPFDVDYHEAIAMVPGMGDDKKGKVIDCVLTGYTLNDKVIRHAKVAVGQ